MPKQSHQYTVYTICAQISSLDAIWAATAARTMHWSWRASVPCRNPEPGLQVWECPQTTADGRATQLICCAQHVQQSVDMSIQLPSGIQCNSVQMTEVVQQEYVLIGRAWLYRRVNVANTVHLSKHHSYCLQGQNRSQKQASCAPSDFQWPWQTSH